MGSPFKKHVKDIFAGIVVFLISLPLSLGIANACHAPLFSGVVAGIVGGIVVGFLSRSNISVSGPAAGLTGVVLLAITQMDTFNVFLCSVVIAGIIQLLLGFLKAGGITNYIPSSVIEGMLAGIGLTIIIKQLPDAIGFAFSKAAVMVDADDGFLMNTIAVATHHIQPSAIFITLIGLTILILWQLKAFKKLQIIPAAAVVVISGTLINALFLSVWPQLALNSAQLVKLPIAASASDFFKQFTLPDIKGFTSLKVWETGIVIAIVASLETLLCIEATDKMDPQKRFTSTDTELKAQGIGNIVCGLLGGLPITAVLVRSSANVNAGAQTKRATIIQGALLLVCAASIPALLNLIPKAALAAILIYTGYRLCKPGVFKHIWLAGRSQFIPFVATIAGVVGLDLLKGVGIGLLISVFYILRQNARIPYYYQHSTFNEGDLIKLTLAQEVSFLNKASIKETLENLPENSNVIIDASEAEYIDFDVLELIRNFFNNSVTNKNIKMSLVGFKNRYELFPVTTPKWTEIVTVFENNIEKLKLVLSHTVSAKKLPAFVNYGIERSDKIELEYGKIYVGDHLIEVFEKKNELIDSEERNYYLDEINALNTKNTNAIIELEKHKILLWDILYSKQPKCIQYLTVQIFLDINDNVSGMNVYDSVLILLSELEFEVAIEYKAEKGSWVKRLITKSLKEITEEEVKHKIDLISYGLELNSIGRVQSEVDKNYSEAMGNIVKAIENCPNAAIRIGMLLVVKITTTDVNGVSYVNVQSKVLNSKELLFINKHPNLCNDPKNILIELSRLTN